MILHVAQAAAEPYLSNHCKANERTRKATLSPEIQMKASNKQENQKVPVFKTRKEEAEFWDIHSPLDFPDYWEDTEVEVGKPLRHEVVLSVRLDGNTSKRMERLAGQRHIGKSTLARMLIIEGLEKLEKAK
jgi:hypothetical protein